MSENFLSEFLMDPPHHEGRINSETRDYMSQMLEFPPPPAPPMATPLATVGAPPLLSSKYSGAVSGLITLIGRILEELDANLPKLLTLNPSRREAILHHLERLAGIPARAATPNQATGPLHGLSASPDPTLGLRRWIEGPRTPAQNAALKTYFEEVAIISLGQALLLKNWSNRGIRPWSQTDLGRLNWALSTTLKTLIPIDREGWQITRPNLYSWYNPGPRILPEIWTALDSWRMSDDGPHYLSALLGPIRRAQPEQQESCGYDARFFQSLWNHMDLLGWDHGDSTGNPLKRNKIVFSPTLRDGTLPRSGPQSVQWIGLESSPFQLMTAELMQIWWGPTPPPLWCIGTGIEVHAKDQLAFVLGSAKPSVLCRIAEMEACDAAFVLEEQTVRTQGRSASSVRFREQVESLPYFKKLRTAGTSLGSLQACVALSKLRPDGIFLWAREEALGIKEGNEVLGYLLDRAKLICEWDFSELEHSLPIAMPLYPKYLYLFKREINIEERLSHRPLRLSVQGQMRSHVEVPIVLEDAFQSLTGTLEPRGHWTILAHSSPTCQRDWIEKWPDPTSHSQVRQLDQLRAASSPLAHFTTVRHTPEGDPNRGGAWSVHTHLKGFWLTSDYDQEGRRLTTRPLPKPGQEAQGQGYLVLVADDEWIPPLRAYLMSALVLKWLDHHCERKGDRWTLNEQIVKWIPVPKTLLATLGVPNALGNSPAHQQEVTALPPAWEKLAEDVAHQPKVVKDAMTQLGHSDSVQYIHCAIFVRAARALDFLYSGQHRLFSMVTADGQIRWRELLHVLPKSECVAVSIHPKLRLTGSLPPHLAIGKIERVKSPSPGILLATESGFSLHLGSDTPLFIQMLWEQLQGVNNPTWSELLQYLRVPRKMEMAQSTALDVLRSHGEESARLKDLRDVLASCQLF